MKLTSRSSSVPESGLTVEADGVDVEQGREASWELVTAMSEG
jgi:hypothetical protein